MNDLIITEEIVWQGSVFRIKRQRIRDHTGRHFYRELASRDDGVAVVPIAADGRVIMIREYTAAARRPLLFIPGGQIRAKTETDRQREAQRELREEIGQRANRLVKLWQVYEAPAMLDRRLHVYLGLDLVADPLPSPDADEVIEIVPLSFAAAYAVLATPDSSSAAVFGALVLAEQYLTAHPNLC
jgi:ADP-ribose pyrophosphatase